jgi:hypothetical protein
MRDASTPLYVLVPPELESEVLEPLREHFAPDEHVEVIVERRAGERRMGIDDRILRDLSMPRSERRAQTVPRSLPGLPPQLEPHAEALRVVQRLTPVRSGLEDLEMHEVVRRAQDGDPDAPTEIYWRTYERVHRRLSLRLADPAAAEREVKPLYGGIFDRLGEFDPEQVSLESWLDRVVDDHAARLRPAQ